MASCFADGVQNLSPVSCEEPTPDCPEWASDNPGRTDVTDLSYLRDANMVLVKQFTCKRIELALLLEKERTGQTELGDDQIETIIDNEFAFGSACRTTPSALCALIRKEISQSLIPSSPRHS